MKKSIFTLFLSIVLTALSAQNWTPMAAGLLPNDVIIFSISAVGDQVVWAVASGDYYQPPIPVSHRPVILRTSDGGQTWVVKEIEEAAGTIVFTIVAEDSLTAWITTQDYGGGPGRSLFKTTDGGEVWVKKLSALGCGVALNRYADTQHWFAHNRQGTSRSANNGDNWTTNNISGYQTNEYQILSSGTNISTTAGDTLWNGTSAGRIVRFTNYGQANTFLTTPLGSSSTITSIAFQDHLNGLLFYSTIAGVPKIAKSTDGGANWTNLLQQPGSGGWNITAVPGAPGSYALSTNYNSTSGKIAITKDFGASWAVETIGKPLNAITFTAPSSGWAGAGRISSSLHPALFKYTGSPLVGVEHTGETLTEFTISPNPVADILRFDFEGSAGNGRILATLSDVSGHPVFSGEIFEKRLDVTRLPAGIYFLKVETADGWAVRKIVRE